jgi:hypothetical protein
MAIASVIFAGVVLYLFTLLMNLIPGVGAYKEQLRFISTLLIVIGVYFAGGYTTEMQWRKKVEEAEAKVAEAEAKGQEETKKIESKVIVKNKIIKDTQVVYRERIKEITKQIDAQCKVDPAVVKALNDASVDPTKDVK